MKIELVSANVGGEKICQSFEVRHIDKDSYEVHWNGNIYNLSAYRDSFGSLVLRRKEDYLNLKFWQNIQNGSLSLSDGKKIFNFEYPSNKISTNKKHKDDDSENALLATMPGNILKIYVKLGDKVVKGQPLVILEAMKMEHEIRAPFDGVVGKIPYQIGELVSQGSVLIDIIQEKLGE